MSHRWMSHVARMDDSCHACKGVMSQIRLNRVMHMNETCHVYKRGASQWKMKNIAWDVHSTSIRMSHVAHTDGSHDTCMDEECHTYGQVTWSRDAENWSLEASEMRGFVRKANTDVQSTTRNMFVCMYVFMNMYVCACAYACACACVFCCEMILKCI